ncbi:esterase-like activity of phytase family protein [Streptomyces sp. NPDC008001]|uniref:esterase-like activity of phytase family protein n=1 Tax=Streptomyces sp. NPDC008001 TaxID=3364804 RepID=UPI0036E4A123
MRTRSALAAAAAALAAATCLSPTTARADAPTRAPAHACSPSVRIDGFSDALDKTTFRGSFVGNLSALAVDKDGTVAALSDRSQLFSLDVRQRPHAAPVRVVDLADEKGGPLDSEGLAVDRDGTRLVTSETEPSVRRYDKDGKLLGRLAVPAALQVAPAGRATANQTFEGLTLQPGGRTLLASMEQSLAGDGQDAAGRPLVRVQSWQRHGRQEFALGPQYAYPADKGLGVAEITAAGDGRLLVLERGFTAGVGNTVRLYLADPRRASDVTAVTHLPGGPATRPMGKKLLADLGACPSLGATARQPQRNPLLDNVEGLAVTRRSGGNLRLLLVSDDNQNPAQITRLYSLTVRLPRP